MTGAIPQMLDCRDQEQVVRYEQAFHTAFQRVRGNRLIRTLWRWEDEEQRLATTIPYADQIVYIQPDGDGGFSAALAVNVAMTTFQSSTFGFQPEPAFRDGACELLTFFAISEHRLANRLRFIGDCFSDLHRRSFSTAYATTAARILPTYRRYFGGTLLAKTEVDGEARYFLRFPLEQAPRRIKWNCPSLL